MLVNDDVAIRDNHANNLAEQGFEVDVFGNRRDAMAHFDSASTDIVFLIIGLAADREGGFQLCADVRRQSHKLPIIFLTSHNRESDRISGLRLGADDYLSTDTSTDFLIVRIETLLRRIETLSLDVCAKHIVRGSLLIDPSTLVAFWKERVVDLSLTHLYIIRALACETGQVKNYGDLMRAANIVVEPNTITAHIKTIRDRFKALDSTFNCIKTARGVGYRWVDV